MSGELQGALTTDEAMAIIYSRCSRDDIHALLSAPDGQALLDIVVETFVDGSKRLDRSVTARHLVPRRSDESPIAGGASYAEVTLPIARRVLADAELGFSVTLPNGALALSDDGHAFALKTPVTFAPGEFTAKTGDFRALLPGTGSTQVAGSINQFAPVAGVSSGEASVTNVGGVQTMARLNGDRFYAHFVGLYVNLASNYTDPRYQFARIVAVNERDQAATITTDLALPSSVPIAAWNLVEWADLGFSVSQPSDTTQGSDDELDEIGRERGRERQAAELDAALRSALTHLIDVVSPNAIVRAVQRAMGGFGSMTLYEVTTSYTDEQAATQLQGSAGTVRAWPGCVADLTPAGMRPTTSEANYNPAGDRPPPRGLALIGPEGAYFLINWESAGAGESGGCASNYTAAGAEYVDDAGVGMPAHAACGVSPAGGRAFGDIAIRRAIAATVQKIKGGGVRWKFRPRKFFTQDL